VINVKAQDISYVTTSTFQLNANRIIEDHKRREIPRFRYVSKTCCKKQKVAEAVERQ